MSRGFLGFLADLPHLTRRFFGWFASSPPSPAEQDRIAALLTEPEALLFFAQQTQDQRHAIVVATRVEARIGEDRGALRAALLHDVGKAGTGLGALRRAIATTFQGVGLPLPGRLGDYRRHGEVGAALLQAAGAEPLAIAFARFHPHPPPAGVLPEDDAARYRVLLEADDT